MKNGIGRRDFLRFAAMGGISLVANSLTGGFTRKAFADDVKELKFVARTETVDLGNGKPFTAWTYNGSVPGPEIRVTDGQTLRVILENRLPESTTIHWHGVPVPNKMDGVPDVTQKPVKPGETFFYEFTASPPGTYVYHSHDGYQLDQGLYGALIIEPKKEEKGFDRDYTLLLEDWATVDGGGPEASRMGRSRSGMMGMMGGGMMGGGMMGRRRAPGDPLLEPIYDLYAINGKAFTASTPFRIKKGDRVRMRIISPASATIFTIRIAGHSLKITHADGRPVVPVTVDALRIGMGERYDIEFIADNPGRWRIYNIFDGGPASGWPLGSVLYDGIEAKSFNEDFSENSRINDYYFMEAVDDGFVKTVKGSPDKVFRMTLSGGMMGSPYWTINGKVYPYTDDFRIRLGEKIRLEYSNMSMMPHPMHLHGHFFEVSGTGGRTGRKILKDTLIVPPHMGRGAIEFVADNPGDWFHHCHNLYHQMGGMANVAHVG